MSKLMQNIDMFGITFNFTTAKSQKFKSIFGGVVTFGCAVLVIVFSILFGKNFFLKKDPKVLTQSVFPKDYPDPVPLTAENFVLPWRFMDENYKTVKAEGIYPILMHYQYKNSPSGLKPVAYTPLTVEKCNKNNSKMSEFNDNFKMDDYFCFDWSKNNLTFGGGVDGTYMNMFTIILSLCPNYAYTFSPNGNCTTPEKFRQLTDMSFTYFDMLYPDVYVVPDDLDKPVRINFKSYFFRFSLGMGKIDRFYFQETVLLDDLGWILDNINTISAHGVADIKSDISLMDVEENYKNNYISAIYALNFFSQKKFVQYNRSFMKIQDLAAIIGGFMEVIMFLGGLIASFYNEILRDYHLYSCLFNYSSTNEVIEKGASVVECNSKNNPRRTSTIQNNNYFEIEIAQQSKFTNKPFLKKNVFKGDKLKTKKQDLLKEIPPSQKLESSNALDFGFWFYMKKTFRCKVNKNLNKINSTLKNYFDEKLDVVFYLKTLQQIDKVKKVAFNDHQSLAFSFIRNPNVGNPEELKTLSTNNQDRSEANLTSLVKYYKDRIQNETLDDADQKLLEIIDPEVKRLSYIIEERN